MKVLVCCESEILALILAEALGAAGLDVKSDTDPLALVPEVKGASVLLVDLERARQAPLLLRDRGFTGRALLVGDFNPEELTASARELRLDGALAATPPEGIEKRLALALESQRKVLIVDDSEIAARMISLELTGKGFLVSYAPDAEKATTIIAKRETRPDLILLDINMPKIDGAQFCRFVKTNEMFRSIKVLFCSSLPKERMEELVRECGADGCLSKDEFLGRWITENA